MTLRRVQLKVAVIRIPSDGIVRLQESPDVGVQPCQPKKE